MRKLGVYLSLTSLLSGKFLCAESWHKPYWTFQNKALSPSEKSLVFDQRFDRKSYQPFPILSNDEKVSKKEALISPFFIRAEVYENLQEPLQKQVSTSTQPVSILASKKIETPIFSSTSIALPKITKAETKPVEVSSSPKAISIKQLPKANGQQATVLVLDEVTLLNQNPKAIENAEIHWIHPNYALSTTTDLHGLAQAPFARTHSTRFVVYKNGYLPAVGYAHLGQVTPVVLYPETRKEPIFKSLSIKDDKKHVIFGKFLDTKLKPISNVFLDLQDVEPAHTFYSVGLFGVFLPFAQQSGPTGDFLAAHLSSKLQYLMPTENSKSEWPSAILNTLGAPKEFSVSILDSRPYEYVFSISDAVYGTPPSGTPIMTTVGGQKGIYWPDEEGYVKIPNLFKRPFPDVIELEIDPAKQQSELGASNKQYLTTWLNVSHSNSSLLKDVALFTPKQLQALLSNKNLDLKNKGIILGKIDRSLAGRKDLKLELIDSFGNKARADFNFFDENYVDQNEAVKFAITSVSSGEWHLILKDSKSNKILSVEVVRTKAGVISQAAL
jgi:hypothetical protein